MKYGYDHCRICGVPIPPGRGERLIQWEKAQRKSPIPEKKWRKLGFLAAPTPYQWRLAPANGCCFTCGLALTKKVYRYNLRFVLSVLGSVFVIVFIGVIMFYMRQ